jgi:hypothetical protein
MKIEESNAMKEIREIRDKMYLDIKDMPAEGRRNYFRAKAEKFKAKLGKELPCAEKIKNRSDPDVSSDFSYFIFKPF